MKQTFFKKWQNFRVMASFAILLGVMFLVYSCSEDNPENQNNIESTDITSEGSLKLMVNGEFEKNIAVNDKAYLLYFDWCSLCKNSAFWCSFRRQLHTSRTARPMAPSVLDDG